MLSSFLRACSLTKGRSSMNEHLWRMKVGFRRPSRVAFALLSLAGYKLFRRTLAVRARTFWGDKMEVVLPEPVSLAISVLGFFEEGLTRMVLEHVREGDIFVDVGAHFGYYTLLASALVRESGQVHAFEPTHSTYALLCKNVAAKGNVVPNNLALYCENTSLPFNDYGPIWSAWNSLTSARLDSKTLEKIPTKRMLVRAVSLDDYVAAQGIDRVSFVKIDAESAEFEILRGMERVITVARPMISIEVGDVDVPDIKSSRELVTHLLERGYEGYEYEGGDIVKHSLRDRYRADNLLFIPK